MQHSSPMTDDLVGPLSTNADGALKMSKWTKRCSKCSTTSTVRQLADMPAPRIIRCRYSHCGAIQEMSGLYFPFDDEYWKTWTKKKT